MPIYFLLMAAVVLLDQLVKFYVTHNIPLNTSVNVISHVLALAHIRNYGAAWNILTGQQLFFFVITIAAW